MREGKGLCRTSFRDVHRWGLVLLGLSLLPFSLTARDYPNAANWSADPPPAGVSPEAYSPNTIEPNFGSDFKPGRGPGAYQDGSYNSYTDPHHPLKNPNKDPGEAWNRRPGQNMPDNSPGVITAKTSWDWGERYYDQEFQASLIITNNCDTPQPVTLFNKGLSYLTMPQSLVVPPGQTTVTGKVKLPPEPPPPIRLGLPGEPGWGWVQPPQIPPQPLMNPPFQFHQPNFAEITGAIVAWHPWGPASGTGCLPARVTYEASGHIHFRPPKPEGGGGPSRIASPDVCEVYWNIGERPAQLKASEEEEKCRSKMQALARRYIEKVLQPYIMNNADDWQWLPDFEALEGMSIAELLAMKARADAQIGAGS